MSASRATFGIIGALATSSALHFAGLGYGPGEEQLQIEGAAMASVARLGNSFADQAAGATPAPPVNDVAEPIPPTEHPNQLPQPVAPQQAADRPATSSAQGVAVSASAEPSLAPSQMAASQPVQEVAQNVVADNQAMPSPIDTMRADIQLTVLSSQPTVSDYAPQLVPAMARPVAQQPQAHMAAITQPAAPSQPQRIVPTASATPVAVLPASPVVQRAVAATPASPTSRAEAVTQAVQVAQPAQEVAPENTITAQEPESSQMVVASSLRPRTRPEAVARARAAEMAEARAQQQAQAQAQAQARAQARTRTRAQAQQPSTRTPSRAGSEARRRGQSDGQAEATAAAASRQSRGQAAQAGTGSASNYPGRVMRRLRSVRVRGGGRRGRAVVGFSIGSGGGLASVFIVTSSGNARLDRNAISHVRRAAPFPAPPSGARTRFSFEYVGR